MSIKPLNRQQSSDLVARNSIFEMTEKVLTTKENDELLVTCVVEKSKPAAEIGLLVIEDYKIENAGELNASTLKLVSSNTDVTKNDDQTFKTLFTSNLKVTPDDHGKMITCNADNGYSNQKWENRRVLNVLCMSYMHVKFSIKWQLSLFFFTLVAPVCKDQENFQYFIGINQSITIECRIKNANPKLVNYDWHFLNNRNFIDYTISSAETTASTQITNKKGVIAKSNNVSTTISKKTANDVDRFVSKIKVKPKSIRDFGEIKCIAANDMGITSCSYELKLGGKL